MRSTIISVANVAASVGKTTLAVSLAAELALRGHQTLLIDADPQAKATDYFINTEHMEHSLADVLCSSICDTNTELSYVSTSLSEVITSTRFNRIDLVPSTIRLAAFESDVLRKDSFFVLNKLKSQIEQLAANQNCYHSEEK